MPAYRSTVKIYLRDGRVMEGLPQVAPVAVRLKAVLLDTKRGTGTGTGTGMGTGMGIQKALVLVLV
jgi:hypothetical protein